MKWRFPAGHAHERLATACQRCLIVIAEAEQIADFLQQGYYALGNSLFWTGELVESLVSTKMAELDCLQAGLGPPPRHSRQADW